MIQLVNISQEFGVKKVLNDISFSVYNGEKIGIVGDNGQGKTTLLNLIIGKQKPDSGQVVVDGKIGFLPQNAEVDLSFILEKLADTHFSTMFFKYLSKFNLGDFDFSIERVRSLSCGEQTKVMLASILAQNCDTLVLDEPTNHLDISGKDCLVNILQSFLGTVILVSHDIDFLNKTVRKIAEVKDGKVTIYEGNYDEYLAQKENIKLNIEREYKKHVRRVKEINEQIDMYKRASQKSEAQKSNAKKQKNQGGGWGFFRQDVAMKKLSTFAKAKINQLEHELDKDVVKPEREHEIRYKLRKEDLKSPFAYKAFQLGKTFDDTLLFSESSFTIESGDKVALIGDNGVGKSTLINILLGKESYSGKLEVSQSVKPVLMQQDVYDLNFESTINEMATSSDKDFHTNFLLNLVTMGLDKSRFDTKIKFLSSGEQMRIKLAQVILSDANVIILDEPTNHLDIANKVYLEKVLSGFKGTLIVISHDRRFLENVTNKTLEIKDKRITLK